MCDVFMGFTAVSSPPKATPSVGRQWYTMSLLSVSLLLHASSRRKRQLRYYWMVKGFMVVVFTTAKAAIVLFLSIQKILARVLAFRCLCYTPLLSVSLLGRTHSLACSDVGYICRNPLKRASELVINCRSLPFNARVNGVERTMFWTTHI